MIITTILLSAALLDGIKQIESSGGLDKRDGDNGKSIGPYQIQKGYFQDALKQNPKLRIYKYQDVRKDHVARAVIRAYWRRYATKSRLGREPTDQDRARIHNGGPNGYKNKATLKYWHKVRKAMKNRRSRNPRQHLRKPGVVKWIG